MAGYCGYSKSCNAVKAEENGLLPLSRITGAPKWAVKLAGEIVGSSEWHHTSSRYNVTYYYDVDRVLSIAKSLKKQYGNQAVAKSEIARKKSERWFLSPPLSNTKNRFRLNCMAWSAGRSCGMTIREILQEMRLRSLEMTGENFRNICAEFAYVNDKNV